MIKVKVQPLNMEGEPSASFPPYELEIEVPDNISKLLKEVADAIIFRAYSHLGGGAR